MTPLLHQVPLVDLDSLCREDLVAHLREALTLATALSEQLATQSEQLAAQSERLASQDEKIAALEARLKKNSSNSSKPPSSDPPWEKRKKKPPSDRKRGGQPGHTGKSRPLKPADEVDEIVDCEPEACSGCGASLEEAERTGRPEVCQVVELPPIKTTTIEHRLHLLTCKNCGCKTRADLPEGVTRRRFGPRLCTLISMLTGVFRLSRRETQTFIRDLCNERISLGCISRIESEMAQQLQPAWTQAAAMVFESDVVHVDETSWRQFADLRWLWGAVSKQAAVYQIDERRNREAFERFRTQAGAAAETSPLFITDRYGVYSHLPESRHSYCWSHLARDIKDLALGCFQGEWASSRLLHQLGLVLELARKRKSGQLDCADLRAAVAPHRQEMERLLTTAAELGKTRTARKCRGLLANWPRFWTWVEHPEADPTNNRIERLLRPAVLWRKGSFGHKGESGAQFVERMLTVKATLRLQERNLFNYLLEASTAARRGLEPPSLFLSTR